MIMIISAIIPFIFLTRYGRQQIGIVKPTRYRWIVYSFIIGVLISTTIFALGYILYSNTYNNWYVYIGQSCSIPPGLSEQDKLVYFLIFAVNGMTFSPIGEELFFRGIVHSSFAKNLGDTKASMVDGSAFALTHLAHFGIVYISGVWEFLFIPSILWVLAMFLTSIIFFQCRRRTGSILGAIICHAGFNLAMIYFIFYHL
ncbi:MAG: CPBP family glutamic-type intramembrane protease [Cyclobacteriaceae bacterium]